MALESDVNTRHALRTPIKMIQGFCDVLLNSSQSLTESQRADVEAIYRNAQQLTELVDALSSSATRALAVAVDLSQLIVLDERGAVYEFFREYLGASTIIRVMNVEEIGRLGQNVKPSAVVIGTGDDSIIPLVAQLVGKEVPILSVSFPALQSQPNYLMKPVQFDELEAMLQRLSVTPRDVLIVDDNRDNVDLLSRMLTSMPHSPRILKAFSGREALALLEEESPNLILMDLVLPDMDGLAIRDYLSLDARRSNIPLIFISAHNSADILTLRRASKLALYQMSSVSPVKLALQIQTLLSVFASNQ
jgi:CheY-like chemotaxis protein